jgi:hypothetical protein
MYQDKFVVILVVMTTMTIMMMISVVEGFNYILTYAMVQDII